MNGRETCRVRDGEEAASRKTVSGKASKLGGIARAEAGKGAEAGGRKVWKRGKGLNGKKKKDLRRGEDSMKKQGDRIEVWKGQKAQGHPWGAAGAKSRQ